ncbi:MAG: tRNA (adenosine(37)-N6)-threonylcarbamoyltransferase complex dimerization subunit type 1 TsaB [Undibacterium sp.]|nr:tRNA (adenosine(37)-N6)-threonylcarbamoyltransferase complex dimerization subunit type 1 TsaB [Undibacterium sp.]
MTKLLAIETSTELASVALFSNNTIFSRELLGVQTHSQGLLPAVQGLLVEAGISVKELTAVAFGCGPGAFTGVRTACGVVQGLAFGLDLPVLPIHSLLAQAQAANTGGQEDQFVCVLDARMNEVYSAHYHWREGAWHIQMAPRLSSFEVVLAYAKEHHLPLVLGKGLVLPLAFEDLPFVVCVPHAAQILELALLDLRLGLQMPAEMAQPLYLRNKIALTTAERLVNASVK